MPYPAAWTEGSSVLFFIVYEVFIRFFINLCLHLYQTTTLQYLSRMFYMHFTRMVVVGITLMNRQQSRKLSFQKCYKMDQIYHIGVGRCQILEGHTLLDLRSAKKY